MTNINSPTTKFPINKKFVEWLDADAGRAQYFSKVDPVLVPPMISKLKAGRMPVRFEIALRLERAQKPSDSPLKAEDLLTFKQDLELLRYVRGIDPAPPLVQVKRKAAAK